MTQHTPGPWTVDVEDECRVIDVQDCTVARTDYVEIEEERDWQVANAALIAAAPETAAERDRLRQVNEAMLEALRGCLDLLEADESNDEWAREFAKPRADAARAALAAAEGRADLGVEPVERPVCTCPFASEGYLSKNCALHAAEGPGDTHA